MRSGGDLDAAPRVAFARKKACGSPSRSDFAWLRRFPSLPNRKRQPNGRPQGPQAPFPQSPQKRSSTIVSDAPPPHECDIVVVGGGILGLATARELLRRRPILDLCVLEGEDRIATHQTGHSSGVVHAGIYYAPGSLKARLCVEGAALLADYCAAKGLPFERSGKLIVAVDETELPRLAELELRGEANGVAGLRRLDEDEIGEIEPHARGVAALHSPATAVVDFVSVAGALAADVAAAGGAVHVGCRVRGSKTDAGRIRISHSRGSTTATAAIFCAGLWADRLAVNAGAPADPRIVPFRGSYLRLRPGASALVRGNIYPVPDPELPFLGAHLTRGVDGTVTIGPTAVLAAARDAYRPARIRASDLRGTLGWPGTWRMARANWRAGAAELRRAASRRSFADEAARLVPALRARDTRRGPAGVRAQALSRDGRLVDDFVVHRTERALHVRNAPSPAATSSLSLAGLIADQLDAIE
jgi:2-hydroxyglutarate dehydrogenase